MYHTRNQDGIKGWREKSRASRESRVRVQEPLTLKTQLGVILAQVLSPPQGAHSARKGHAPARQVPVPKATEVCLIGTHISTRKPTA